MSAGLLEKLSDKTSPIVVKELRQAVKSKAMVVLFMIVLTISLCVAVAATTAHLRSGPSGGSEAREMVMSLALVELFLGALFVSFLAMRGVMDELQDRTHELVVLAGIRPAGIVWGKLLSVSAQLLVYYSSVAPFVAFAYLLGGVDIYVAVAPSFMAFLLSLLFALFAIFMGALARSAGGRSIASVLFVIFSIGGGLITWAILTLAVGGGLPSLEALIYGAIFYAVPFLVLFAFCVARFEVVERPLAGYYPLPETNHRSATPCL